VKHGNDQVAALVERAGASHPKTIWGLGTINPLGPAQIAEGERCMARSGSRAADQFELARTLH